MEHLTQNLQQSINWGFIDSQTTALEQHKPKLLINDKNNNEYVLTTVLEELTECNSFVFSVAFVTESGLATMKSQLLDLKNKGISGRVLTSTYLYFNKPKVFRELLKIKNIDVRVTDLAGFHTKGYIFHKKDDVSIIMGSSNLTAKALKQNYEWNLKLSSHTNGGIVNQFVEEIDRIWDRAKPLTNEWIDTYEVKYQKQNKRKILSVAIEQPFDIEEKNIKPNKMQINALQNLISLRENAAQRALIISATGTGKTYLAAFDVKSFAPERMLFIVHSEQIIRKSIQDFKQVLGGNDQDYGILSGKNKEIKAKYLFATIQTLSKYDTLNSFSQNHFDYILIDEVHKAGAETYLRVIDYFTPKFLLGVTATPERTDDFNIYELFEYNIAYEIRLQEALDEDMLCPFHYFGVTDYEKDGEVIDDTSKLSNLINSERVNYLVDKIEYYGYSGEKIRGLIFCSNVQEAKELSVLLNQRGYKTCALTGENSQAERIDSVDSLMNGTLDYILTVDIFNEGIDIPSINQVVMLRKTQSSIIFIQQLGRGLRKHESKEYVTIIDFIGNYKNNYLIPIALSGDKSLNKDNLRKSMKDTSYIRGISTINFEEVAKQRIFNSINISRLSDLKNIKDNYMELKNRLNKIPTLEEFTKYDSIDPLIFPEKFSSYYNFLVEIKEIEPSLSNYENNIITMLSNEILNGKRKHEIILLDILLEKGSISLEEYLDVLAEKGCRIDQNTINSVVRVLNLSFFTEQNRKKYGEKSIVNMANQIFSLSDDIGSSLKNNRSFLSFVKDIITTAYIKNNLYDDMALLTLYKKYSRKDSCKLLNWLDDETSTLFGYKIKYQTCPIFVTYHKNEDIDSSVKYADEFLNTQVLRWATRSNRKLSSEEVKTILDANEKNIKLHVFVKKDNAEGTDFYYLGKAKPISGSEKEERMTNEQGKDIPVVHMDLLLESPVQSKLYNYLTNS
ncbi:DEAD/DEAH box helicase [Paenibacillus hunanensis]|uniref:DUF3427 domain-containing protein n=1 Tax=Paenibacillus hunanensis TaxID=539262 RepID=UPI0020272DE1|nr:DEAD/DEAH box helicase [Paenibacillus hunanensis]MCL9663588.1 DEAD/DEAH box helicase [Paenibacillus hunanensis]